MRIRNPCCTVGRFLLPSSVRRHTSNCSRPRSLPAHSTRRGEGFGSYRIHSRVCRVWLCKCLPDMRSRVGPQIQPCRYTDTMTCCFRPLACTLNLPQVCFRMQGMPLCQRTVCRCPLYMASKMMSRVPECTHIRKGNSFHLSQKSTASLVVC